MKPSLKISTLTLEAVAEHFAQWRADKRPGERIPQRLWQEAIDLLDRYQISQVTRVLRLSGTDLNRRRGIVGRERSGEVESSGDRHAEMALVQIDRQAVAQACAQRTATARLELHRPDGLCLHIHPGDGRELLALVDHFMGR